MNGAPEPRNEKREAVTYAVSRGLAQRRGCTLFALNRSTARYLAHGGDDTALVQSIQTLQAEQPRFGVRRIYVLLCQGDIKVNRKRVQRVMHVHNLQVIRRRTKKTIRTGARVPQRAEYPNHVWTIDFQEDALIGGRKVRVLNILDEFTREWLAVVVGASASATTVLSALQSVFRERRAPTFLRSDNGGEFIAGSLAALLTRENVNAFFIEPGSPWQNGFIESFHGKVRDELLNRESFVSVREAQARLDRHRIWYNQKRPHSALAYLTPETYRREWEEREADTEKKRTDINTTD